MTPDTTDESEHEADGVDVTVQERGAWKRTLTITVDPDRVAETRDQIRQELAGQLNLKGFRKGHVPPKIVEQRYGPVVDERTVQSLVDRAYREAVDTESLDPIGEPEVHDVQYREGASLVFQVDVEIMPTLELERTGGFRVERPDVTVTDDEMDEILDRLRDEHASLKPVDRSPREGDEVSVRIGPADDGSLSDSDQYRFELGEGYALPGVEEAIRSMSPGESGTFEVEFPDDSEDADEAGESRHLRIELREVKTKEPPPLDDAFAGRVGDHQDLAGLRNAVREDIHRHKEEEAENQVREQLLEGIIEANPFEVPEAMVEDYLDRVIDAPPEAPEEKVKAARQEFRPRAKRQIKRHLILSRLVEREGMEATDQEVDERIGRMAEEREVEPARMRRQLARQDELEQLRRQVAVEKVFEYLKSRSTVE